MAAAGVEVIYGFSSVQTALRAGRRQLHRLHINKSFVQAKGKAVPKDVQVLRRWAEDGGVPVIYSSKQVLQSKSGVSSQLLVSPYLLPAIRRADGS